MFLVNIFISITYLFGIKFTRQFFLAIQDNNYSNFYNFLIAISVSTSIYAIYRLVISLKKVIFDRYYIQYIAIPNFEKFLKTKIQKKASVVDVLDYDKVNISKKIHEATVSSTNIFRLFEIFMLKFSIIFNFIIIFRFLLNINWIYIVLIILSISPLFIENTIKTKYISKNRKILNKYEAYEKEIVESIIDVESFGELKIYNTIDFMVSKLSETIKEHNKEYEKILRKNFIVELISKIIYIIGMILTYLGVILTFKEDKNITNLITILISIRIFMDFSKEVISLQSYSTMFSKMVEPYFDFMNIKNTTKRKSNFCENKIVLKDVNFKYPSLSNYTLKNINLEINPGEIIAIVGENGSGKSTLSKILMGLYEIDNGEIFDFTTNENKSILFQDFCKYPVSLDENISLGTKSNKNLKDIKKNLKIDYKSNILGKEFGNSDLSGGQWQRISIARALYKNYEFLILDEPTAEIDPIFEIEIYNKFKEMLKEKTGVIITHKLGSIKFVDKIIIMDKGKIIDIGKHNELLNRNNIYQKIWNAHIENNL